MQELQSHRVALAALALVGAQVRYCYCYCMVLAVSYPQMVLTAQNPNWMQNRVSSNLVGEMRQSQSDHQGTKMTRVGA